MAKLEGVKIIDAKNGEITKIQYEGNTYVNVGDDRDDFKVGDIALNKKDAMDADAGNFYEVRENEWLGFTTIYDDANESHSDILYHSDIFRKEVASDLRITDEEAEKFKVGDYVKVVGDTHCKNIGEGDIAKIVASKDVDGDYEIGLLDESDYDYAKPESLEKVEITSRELSFFNAGRELNEYKVGDIVRVLFSPVAHPKQSIIEITGFGPDYILAKGYDDDIGRVEEYYYDVEDLELIAPAESRVDNKGDGEDV